MKMTEIIRTPGLVAVGMTVLLTLTACSGGAEGYDFTEPLAEGVPSIEFTIPRELAELNEEYVENRVLDSVTVSAADSEDPSECAVEYRFDYADGGLERLLEQAESSDMVLEGTSTVEDRVARYLVDLGVEYLELAEDYGSAVVPTTCVSSPEEDHTAIGRKVLFPWVKEGDRENLATALVTTMRSGDLYVHEPEVQGWQVDSDGNWIKK